MARNDLVKPVAGDWPVTNPWLPLTVGLVATALGVLLAGWTGTAGVLVRLAVIGVGLLATAAAVWLRLHYAGWDLEERSKSAGLVALAAVAVVLAFAGLDPAWDSARLVLGVLTGVALTGALLLLLPTAVRKVTILLLVLVHFGGILAAVTSVAPPGQPAPWLTMVSWTYFYRPYLQFMYLNNAYHFYSPEPGPPTLLWFHIDYADGSARWVRLPERDQFHTKQEYQRRLALAESTNHQNNGTPPLFQHMIDLRERAGRRVGVPPAPASEMTPELQYREPVPYSKLMIASYARHVARTYRSEKDPDAAVEGVKVYRVVHTILYAKQMADGLRPDAPTTYLPYFQGEFDKDGTLKDPNDPFLYWLIPIMWVPKDQHKIIILTPQPRVDSDNYELKDFTRVHGALKTNRAGQ